MSDRPLPFYYQFAAGAVAGLSELMVMYPLDVVKTRMQLQRGGEPTAGVVGALRTIVAKEGFARLYKGISSPVCMEAPKRATKFAFNDIFQNQYKRWLQSDRVTQQIAIASGTSAGVVEALVVTPFELVKIRLQDANSKLNGPREVLRSLVRDRGVAGLYTGLESTVWRHGVWNAGYFGVIFQVRALLPEARTKTRKTVNDLVAGTIGGTVGSLLNTPFDVVKSRVQGEPDLRNPRYGWAWPGVLRVYREEGFAALYKGFVPKVLRLGPGGGIMLVVFSACMSRFEKWHYG